MASNKLVKGFMAVAATVSVAALAGCPGTTPGQVGPSATPTGTPTTSPTATPSDQPTTPAPTALPSSADTQSVATVRGLIEDESGNRLDGVTITAKVLSSGATFANGSDSLTVTSTNGSYVLNGAPTGVIVEIVATKTGYSERRLAHTPLANTTGQGDVNDVNFTGVNALTDRPEVLSITPGDKTVGVDPATSFTITFSTPMDKKTAEDNFRIALNTEENGLDADTQATLGRLPTSAEFSDAAFDKKGHTTHADYIAAEGPKKVFGVAGNILFDGSYFNKEWSNNNTVLTLTWKDSNQLITDKDSGDVPEYAIFFLSGVKNANGTQAANVALNHADSKLGFTPKTTAGDLANTTTIAHQIFRIGTQSKSKVTFTVTADTTKPQVDNSLVLINTGTTLTNKARVKFNERMALGTLFGAYGYNAAMSTANIGTSFAFAGFGATTPQAVAFYPDDQSKKTLEFTNMAFGAGSHTVKVNTAVKDPAGNEIDKDYEEAKGVI